MRKSCDCADRVILKIAAEARDPVTVRYDGRNCENIDAIFALVLTAQAQTTRQPSRTCGGRLSASFDIS